MGRARGYRGFTQFRTSESGGFTLIEMMVAVALFAVVMLIAGSTLLSLVFANRKAEALQSVMNNLNVSLDGMVRAMRMGSDFRCGSQTPSDGDCPGGGTVFYFTPFGGDPADRNDDWAYEFVCLSGLQGGACPSGGYIAESENNGPWLAITAPEVQIQSMAFYVIGTEQGTEQPKVVVTIKGEAGGADSKTETTFNIQATAVQRLLNL